MGWRHGVGTVARYRERKTAVNDGQVISQKILVDSLDLEELHIIDWSRFKPTWKNTSEAIRGLGAIVRGHFAATLVSYDLRQEPERSDFPQDWEHQGSSHNALARVFWNFYRNHQMGEIALSDKPDFGGTFVHGEQTVDVWGDFGQVSPISFLLTIWSMKKGDLWVSVPDEQHQVILECVEDFQKHMERVEALFASGN